MTALGFAATENVQYIYEHGYLSGGWEGFWQLAFIRILVVAWQHPFYTAFTGIGLAVARLQKNVFVKTRGPEHRLRGGGVHACLPQQLQQPRGWAGRICAWELDRLVRAGC